MGVLLFQQEAGLPRLLPLTTTLLFALISVVPLHIPSFAAVTPAFTLMAVYHWTIYRSDLLPPTGVFLIGLLLDLLSGTPYVGSSPLTLLLARSAILSQRQLFADRAFAVLWGGFLVTVAVTVVFEWALMSVLHGGALGGEPFVFEAALTVATFPVASYLLARTQRAFLMRL
jgi:rod shape-determining protein MreD